MTTSPNSPVTSGQPKTQVDKVRVPNDLVNLSTEKSAPHVITFDSNTLSVIDDYIQGLSSECKNLAMALNSIITNDPASKGVIAVVRATLLTNSKKAAKLRADIRDSLPTLPELEVDSYVSK